MTNYWSNNIFRIEGGIAIIINITVVSFVLSRRRLRHKFTNIFFINLLLSHVAEGAVAIYIGETFDNSNTNQVGRPASRMRIVFFSFDTLLSCLNNIPVTGDRLIAIRWPFLYQKLSLKSTIAICVIPWIISLVYLLVIIICKMSAPTGDIVAIVYVTIIIVILIASNTVIYKIVKRHTTAIKTTCIEIPYASNDISLSGNYSSEDVGSPRNHLRKISEMITKPRSYTNRSRIQGQQRRSAYICIGVVCSYIVSFVPHLIYDILKLTKASPCHIYTGSLAAQVTIFIAFFNAIVDPIIYTMLNRGIKREFKRILKPQRTPSI